MNATQYQITATSLSPEPGMLNPISARMTRAEEIGPTQPPFVSTYAVTASILSFVNLRLTFNNSCATSGSCFCNFCQLFSFNCHTTQSFSAVMVAVRIVSE